ncbi:MAG: hypothetical protein ABGX27_01770 [Desulfurobacteriaceae bacterium]
MVNKKSRLEIVEELKNLKRDLFEVARLKNFLREKLNRNVDLGLYDSVNPFIERKIDD